MVDDEELEKLRKQRERELQEAEHEVSGEDAMDQQRQQIKQMAAQYLTKEARQRLGNIRAAKPELASAVETQIVQLGRTGQIEKISDEQLKGILKEVQANDEDTDIKFRR